MQRAESPLRTSLTPAITALQMPKAMLDSSSSAVSTFIIIIFFSNKTLKSHASFV